MRMLFEIDKKNYKENGTVGTRPSVRGIIIKNGLLAMVHSLKYNYYKFPGGGAENGEDRIDTLIREVREESGLDVIPQSVREYGQVRRIQKGNIEDIFIQDNFYYFCEAESGVQPQELDDYEAEERFTLEFVSPAHAIGTNSAYMRNITDNKEFYSVMIERENKVLSMLLDEHAELFV